MAVASISAAIIANPRLSRPGDDRCSATAIGAQDRLTLEPWIELCAPRCDDLILVTADPLALLAWEPLIVRDHFDPPGVLSAIHAGLFAARHEHLFVTDGAMPTIAPALLDWLLHAVDPRRDALILETALGAQPLPAIYHKRSLNPLSKQLAKSDDDARRFLRHLRVQTIEEKQWRARDPAWTPFVQGSRKIELEG